MSAVPITRQVSVDDAIEEAWAAVLSGQHPNVAEAVRAAWPSLRVSSTTLDMLACEGLIEMARQAKSQTMRQRDSRPAVPFGSPHGKKWERYVALSWPFEAANGSQIPLAEFTRSDLSAFAARCGTLIQSFTRRRDWAVDTDRLLVEHGKARVVDLPAAVLERVEASARDAMGRQS